MTHFFKKALPTWPNNKEKNFNIFYHRVSDDDYEYLTIASSYPYQVFLNNDFVFYGPKRAAENYFRVDTIELKVKKGDSILISCSAYNVSNFYFLKQIPFICFELCNLNKVLTVQDFNCYKNEYRFQKVVRFSYQRGFSESYDYRNKFDLFNCKKVNSLLIRSKLNFIESNISNPFLKETTLDLLQCGDFVIDKNKSIYSDRFMDLNHVEGYERSIWDVDSIETISRLSFKRNDVIKSTFKNNQFQLYVVFLKQLN